MILLLIPLLLEADSILTMVKSRSQDMPTIKGKIEIVVEYPKADTLLGRFYLKENKLLLRTYQPVVRDFLFTDTILTIYDAELNEKIIKKGISKINRPIPYVDVGPGLLSWTQGWELHTLVRDSIKGYDVYVLEGNSRDTTQVYRRSLFWIDAGSYLIRRVEFYDQNDLENFIYVVKSEQEVGSISIPSDYSLRFLTEFGILVLNIKLSAIKQAPSLSDSLFQIGG